MSRIPTGEAGAARLEFATCREEVKHEYNVLAGRLNSYILSQSFLVSGYAVAMGNSIPEFGARFRVLFPALLCTLGLFLSVRAHPGISRVCKIIDRWHGRQDELLLAHSELAPYEMFRMDNPQGVHKRDLLFAQTSTWIFGSAWVLLALLSVYLYFTRTR